MESILNGGHSECKGPEAGVCLVILRNSKETSVAGFSRSGERKWQAETWQAVRSCWASPTIARTLAFTLRQVGSL